ncbi:hypothetical protein TWF481_008706 [Arthrobotrys musiformis]|uniref:Uncharacterized protein n=1 Tax=Arthrobotrys musiformis TaxID=47236 RepID=A0AAV9W9V4_9PEZI
MNSHSQNRSRSSNLTPPSQWRWGNADSHRSSMAPVAQDYLIDGVGSRFENELAASDRAFWEGVCQFSPSDLSEEPSAPNESTSVGPATTMAYPNELIDAWNPAGGGSVGQSQYYSTLLGPAMSV